MAPDDATSDTPDAPPGGAAGPRVGDEPTRAALQYVRRTYSTITYGGPFEARRVKDFLAGWSAGGRVAVDALAEIGEKARQALVLAADEDVDAALYSILDAARLALAAVRPAG